MPCRASKLLVQVGVLESSLYVNHISFSSDLPKPRCLVCKRVLTEYLPLSLFSFLTHRHFIVSMKYLPEFYTSSLYITSLLTSFFSSTINILPLTKLTLSLLLLLRTLPHRKFISTSLIC